LLLRLRSRSPVTVTTVTVTPLLYVYVAVTIANTFVVYRFVAPLHVPHVWIRLVDVDLPRLLRLVTHVWLLIYDLRYRLLLRLLRLLLLICWFGWFTHVVTVVVTLLVVVDLVDFLHVDGWRWRLAVRYVDVRCWCCWFRLRLRYVVVVDVPVCYDLLRLLLIALLLLADCWFVVDTLIVDLVWRWLYIRYSLGDCWRCCCCWLLLLRCCCSLLLTLLLLLFVDFHLEFTLDTDLHVTFAVPAVAVTLVGFGSPFTFYRSVGPTVGLRLFPLRRLQLRTTRSPVGYVPGCYVTFGCLQLRSTHVYGYGYRFARSHRLIYGYVLDWLRLHILPFAFTFTVVDLLHTRTHITVPTRLHVWPVGCYVWFTPLRLRSLRITLDVVTLVTVVHTVYVTVGSPVDSTFTVTFPFTVIHVYRLRLVTVRLRLVGTLLRLHSRLRLVGVYVTIYRLIYVYTRWLSRLFAFTVTVYVTFGCYTRLHSPVTFTVVVTFPDVTGCSLVVPRVYGCTYSSTRFGYTHGYTHHHGCRTHVCGSHGCYHTVGYTRGCCSAPHTAGLFPFTVTVTFRFPHTVPCVPRLHSFGWFGCYRWLVHTGYGLHRTFYSSVTFTTFRLLVAGYVTARLRFILHVYGWLRLRTGYTRYVGCGSVACGSRYTVVPLRLVTVTHTHFAFTFWFGFPTRSLLPVVTHGSFARLVTYTFGWLPRVYVGCGCGYGLILRYTHFTHVYVCCCGLRLRGSRVVRLRLRFITTFTFGYPHVYGWLRYVGYVYVYGWFTVWLVWLVGWFTVSRYTPVYARYHGYVGTTFLYVWFTHILGYVTVGWVAVTTLRLPHLHHTVTTVGWLVNGWLRLRLPTFGYVTVTVPSLVVPYGRYTVTGCCSHTVVRLHTHTHGYLPGYVCHTTRLLVTYVVTGFGHHTLVYSVPDVTRLVGWLRLFTFTFAVGWLRLFGYVCWLHDLIWLRTFTHVVVVTHSLRYVTFTHLLRLVTCTRYVYVYVPGCFGFGLHVRLHHTVTFTVVTCWFTTFYATFTFTFAVYVAVPFTFVTLYRLLLRLRLRWLRLITLFTRLRLYVDFTVVIYVGRCYGYVVTLFDVHTVTFPVWFPTLRLHTFGCYILPVPGLRTHTTRSSSHVYTHTVWTLHVATFCGWRYVLRFTRLRLRYVYGLVTVCYTVAVTVGLHCHTFVYGCYGYVYVGCRWFGWLVGSRLRLFTRLFTFVTLGYTTPFTYVCCGYGLRFTLRFTYTGYIYRVYHTGYHTHLWLHGLHYVLRFTTILVTALLVGFTVTHVRLRFTVRLLRLPHVYRFTLYVLRTLRLRAVYHALHVAFTLRTLVGLPRCYTRWFPAYGYAHHTTVLRFWLPRFPVPHPTRFTLRCPAVPTRLIRCGWLVGYGYGWFTGLHVPHGCYVYLRSHVYTHVADFVCYTFTVYVTFRSRFTRLVVTHLRLVTVSPFTHFDLFIYTFTFTLLRLVTFTFTFTFGWLVTFPFTFPGLLRLHTVTLLLRYGRLIGLRLVTFTLLRLRSFGYVWFRLVVDFVWFPVTLFVGYGLRLPTLRYVCVGWFTFTFTFTVTHVYVVTFVVVGVTFVVRFTLFTVTFVTHGYVAGCRFTHFGYVVVVWLLHTFGFVICVRYARYHVWFGWFVTFTIYVYVTFVTFTIYVVATFGRLITVTFTFSTLHTVAVTRVCVTGCWLPTHTVTVVVCYITVVTGYGLRLLDGYVVRLRLRVYDLIWFGYGLLVVVVPVAGYVTFRCHIYVPGRSRLRFTFVTHGYVYVTTFATTHYCTRLRCYVCTIRCRLHHVHTRLHGLRCPVTLPVVG